MAYSGCANQRQREPPGMLVLPRIRAATMEAILLPMNINGQVRRFCRIVRRAPKPGVCNHMEAVVIAARTRMEYQPTSRNSAHRPLRAGWQKRKPAARFSTATSISRAAPPALEKNFAETL